MDTTTTTTLGQVQVLSSSESDATILLPQDRVPGFLVKFPGLCVADGYPVCSTSSFIGALPLTMDLEPPEEGYVAAACRCPYVLDHVARALEATTSSPPPPKPKRESRAIFSDETTYSYEKLMELAGETDVLYLQVDGIFCEFFLPEAVVYRFMDAFNLHHNHGQDAVCILPHTPVPGLGLVTTRSPNATWRDCFDNPEELYATECTEPLVCVLCVSLTRVAPEDYVHTTLLHGRDL